MFSIYDVNGYMDDLGSSVTISSLESVAKNLKLEVLISLFRDGFTINIDELVDDLQRIDLAQFGELEDIIENILEIVERSDEIVIITDDLE